MIPSPTGADAAPTLRSSALPWLVLAGLVACAAGLLWHRMWDVLPWGRFGESLVLAGVVAALGWPLRRRRGWSLATSWLLVWGALLVLCSGVLPTLAVLLLLIAATALGGLLTGDSRIGLATVLGLALLAGMLGWLLPLPVHRAWTYAPLLLALIAWRQRALRDGARAGLADFDACVVAAPRAAAFAVMLLGLASTGAWLPTLQYDDLAYHLGLPWQLQETARYALDPTHQVWALAPWAGDVLQAVPQVLVDAEARGPLNAAWLALTALGLWRLGDAIGLDARHRWASIALLGSLPLVAALQGSMQTETAATAVTVWLAAHVATLRGDARRGFAIIGVLFALLVALKLVHAIAALPLLAWGAWRGRHLHRRWAGVAIALALLPVLAGSSYAYAWHVAGNPLLPMFNATFRSPYFALRDFGDARWQAGFDAALPWQLSFDTSTYLEAADGGIGFVLVALAGAVIVGLADRRARALGLCALAASLLPLVGLQYARYAHAGMVLLLPVAMAGLQRGAPWPWARWIVVVVCAANLAFQANAHWLLRTGGVKRSVAALGRDAPLLERRAPERLLIAAIRERDGRGNVLLLSPSMPAHAELGTRGRTTAWYAPRFEAARIAADADTSGRAWIALWRRGNITDLIVRPADLTPAQRTAFAASGARLERTLGDAQWWQLPAENAR